MPQYCFRSPEGVYEWVTWTMSEMEKRTRGDVWRRDGVDWKRDYTAEHRGFDDASCRCWPMVSEAAAVHPDQVSEATTYASSIGIPTQFDRMGRPIFENRSHRKRYLAAYGFYDRNGGYGD